MIASLPLLAVIVTAIIATVMLTLGSIPETYAIIMILTLLSAYILDQAIENIFFKEKFNDTMKIIERNTSITESIHKELHRQKVPCELVDPCVTHIWDFEEELLWYNAPLVLAEDEIFETVLNAYSKAGFKKAKYVFYKGESEEDKVDFQKRINRYNEIKKKISINHPEIANKITAKVIPDSPPRISFFLGKKRGIEEGIVYVMEPPFAMHAKKGEEPGYVFIIQEEELIRRLRSIFNNEWSKGQLLEEVSSEPPKGKTN
jgi:hypothetical protein